MGNLRSVCVALALSAFVASCFSGSSTSGTTAKRKAPKRLGETAAASETTPAATESAAAASSTPAAAAADTTAGQKTLRTLYVNVASANVRAMPSREATVVSKVKFLDPVAATGLLDGEWVQIEVTMPDGNLTKAWIHSTLVSASKEQAEAARAAERNK